MPSDSRVPSYLTDHIGCGDCPYRMIHRLCLHEPCPTAETLDQAKLRAEQYPLK